LFLYQSILTFIDVLISNSTPFSAFLDCAKKSSVSDPFHLCDVAYLY
jgi:hypothetical protein